ncbi:MAG: DMT family transporter, partial [Propionibacteriaceae bacterium]
MTTSTKRTGDRAAPLALTALIVMAMLWGSTFFSLKIVLAHMPVADMLAVRFTISALVLAVVGWRHFRMSRKTLRRGIFLGLLWGAAQLLQTFGIASTPASTSAFITGLYVVMTPIIGWFAVRHRVPRVTWFAIILSTLGMAVFSLNGSGFSLSFGSFLILLSAIFYGGHIIATGEFATAENAMSLCIVTMIVLALMCWIAAIPGGIVIPTATIDWLWLLYLAVLCGTLTMFLQTWAQAHIAPERAAVIMSMEP